MTPVWWVLWSVIAAAGTAGFVYLLMRSRTEVLLSKQREELAAARASLEAQKQAMEDSLRNVEDATKRRAMDEFLADIRVEERHYLREHKVLFVTRKCLIRQERIFFRNIPLSNWVEHEMPFEEGADLEKLAQAMSVFTPEGLLETGERRPRKLLH
jgi:hypothetical protein